MTLLEKINDRMEKRHKETLPGETNISNPPLGRDLGAGGKFTYLVSAPEHEEETNEEIENTLGTVHVSRPSIKHVFFLLRPFLKPLLEQFSKQEQQLSELVKLITMEHVFIDRPYAISQNVPYAVDYKGHKLLYIMTNNTGFPSLVVNGVTLAGMDADKWYPLLYPPGTQIYASGVSDAIPITFIVRACDIPMSVYAHILAGGSVGIAPGGNTIGNVGINAGNNAIGYVGQQFANPAGVEEIVHDNWDNITGQTLTAVGPGTYTAAQTNPYAIGLMVVVNITAISGPGTLTVSIQNVDPVSGATFNLLTSATLSTISKTAMMVYPSIPVAANSTANGALTRSWQISSVEAGASTTVTAAISVSYIV